MNTIRQQDAEVLRWLGDFTLSLEDIAMKCGITMQELRESMQRLALRSPGPKLVVA